MLGTKNHLQNHIKNAKATKFLLQSAFYTSKGCTCKLLPFYDFGLRFTISSVLPTRSSTFYAYLITQLRNRNAGINLTAYHPSPGHPGAIAPKYVPSLRAFAQQKMPGDGPINDDVPRAGHLHQLAVKPRCQT